MKDNVGAPNLGQSNKDFDAQFFWQSYRAIEQWMQQVVSKGDIQVANLAADNGTIGDLTISGSFEIPSLGLGLLAHTSPTSFSPRSLTAPAAGLTITNANGVAGNPTFALANDLAAVEGLATTGLARRTGTDTWDTTVAVAASVKITSFIANGTFTPDAKMLFCEVWGWGGGGGGGPTSATAATTGSIASGGNGGALAYGVFTKADIGASQAVTIGGGGASATAGGNTTLGTLLSAKGGEAGVSAGPASSGFGRVATAPGQSATGLVRGWTVQGSSAFIYVGGANVIGGSGGNTIWGGGGAGNNSGTGGVGGAAQANTGSGGGGAGAQISQAAFAGGAGGSGIMIIKEYLSL